MIRKILTDTRQVHAENPKLLQSVLLFCLFVSLFVVSPFVNIVLDLSPKVSDFSNHIISNAAAKDFQISSRIRYYFLAFLLVAGFMAALFLPLLFWLKNRYISSDSNSRSIQTVANFSVIGIASVFAGFFLANVDVALFFIVILGSYLLVSTTKSARYWDIENAFWMLTLSIPLAIVAFRILMQRLAPENPQIGVEISQTFLPVQKYGLIFCLVLLAIVALLWAFVKGFLKTAETDEGYLRKRNRLYRASIPVSAVLIVLCVLLEFFNILNLKYNYLFNSPLLLFALLAVFAIGFSCVLYLKKTKKDLIDSKVLANCHFPLLVIGILLMIAQPWRIYQPENEFFEFANHGLAVDHFFRYGSIPIIENYDAHMLSGQLFAYLYGFTSGYEPWAPFIYYNFVDVIYALVVYFVFRRIFGAKTALVLLLCFPIMGLVINSFALFGLVGLTLHNLVSSPSRKSFYWFWLSILFTCVFRLDLGFAGMLAGVFGYFSVQYLLKQPLHFKRFLVTACVTFGSALVLFFVLCLAKSVNPLARLKEFLLISSSNQNWAYQTMGDTSHVAFRICYYLLPLLVVLLLLHVLLQSWISKDYLNQVASNKKNQAAFVFFVFFAAAYFLNLPRGIVRHSYAEDILTTVVSCLPLAIICFICIKKREHNMLLVLSCFLAMYVLTGLNVKTYKNRETSLFSKGLNSAAFQEKFTESYAFNGSRVKVGFSLSEVNYFKNVLDAVLKPGETYFDFSSTNYYFALVGRKNPVYVNQSPLLINGDDSQHLTLDQIRKAGVSLVLMPNKNTKWKSIDYIDATFKYYLISEYIHENFVPLLNLGSFDIYVRKDKKQSYENLLKAKLGSSNAIQTDDFSAIDTAKIVPNNATVEIAADKSLLVKAIGADAFFLGLFNQINGYDLLDKNAAVKISLTITVPAAGTFQLFYQLPGDASFSEEHSKRFTFAQAGEHEVLLDLPSCPLDLRMDLETPQIGLKRIKVVSAGGAGFQLPVPINIPLDEIPRLWAEKGDADLFGKVPKLDEPLKQSALNILLANPQIKGKPSYLFVEADATAMQPAVVTVFDAQNQPKGVYNFNLQPGKHQYAIRLTADYYWWHGNLAKLSFTTAGAVSVTKFALVSADGKNTEAYKGGEMTLSNITDQNWQNGIGVGDQANLLLIDNSRRNWAALQKGRFIELTDGARIQITAKEQVGDFIRVSFAQDIQALKPKLQYPNNIKIAN